MKLKGKTKLNIAIVSDLHCTALQQSPKVTHLTAGAVRTPVNQHPVQALLELIKEEPLSADVLVCPGDLAHQVCSVGMLQAWDHLGEIQRKLRAKLLLPTIGNHDVDSRNNKGSDPFDIPRSIHPEFPRPQRADQDMFWSRGFYHAKLSDLAGFVVLNTVIRHTDKQSAERGTFDASHIDAMRAHLRSIYEKKGAPLSPIRVAVMHHHPIAHSTAHFGSPDTLEFGDQILGALAEFQFRFVIHGHRHEPRITRHLATGIEQLVFAAGSFSAQLDSLASRTKNLFHVLSLESQENDLYSGCLRTWEFTLGNGWEKAHSPSASIPFESNIRTPCPHVSADEVIAQCKSLPGEILRHADITRLCPQLLHLLPTELKQQKESLKAKGYKLVQDESGEIIEIAKPVTL